LSEHVAIIYEVAPNCHGHSGPRVLLQGSHNVLQIPSLDCATRNDKQLVTGPKQPLLLGGAIATAAAVLPISILGDLVSLGTATAFGIVCLSVMYLRSTRPDLERPFRVPGGGVWINGAWIGLVPVLGIFFCLVMVTPLVIDIVIKARSGDPIPAILLLSYGAVGAIIYIFYGYKNSRLAKGLDVLDVGPDAQ
jgi:APA family basic amino acid/polyamine antiporter